MTVLYKLATPAYLCNFDVKALGELKIDTTKLETGTGPLMAQLEEEKRAIRAGFYAALFSLCMTLLITVLGATGTADMGIETDWYMLFDVGLIAVFALGLWFKSRTAATLMFIYFLLSKIILWAGGNFKGIITGVVFYIFMAAL